MRLLIFPLTIGGQGDSRRAPEDRPIPVQPANSAISGDDGFEGSLRGLARPTLIDAELDDVDVGVWRANMAFP